MQQRPDANDNREHAKGILEYFPSCHFNNFDPAIGALIQQLKQLINESSERMEILDQQLGAFQLDVNATWQQVDLIQEQADAEWENLACTDELLAILEMQIIYAFKYLETGMKAIMKRYYNADEEKSFFIWDRMKAFLKGIGIRLEQLDKYREVDQLRRVNNNLKHDQKPDERKLSDIPEFHAKQRFDTRDLEAFYERVRPCQNDFITSFAKAVYEERFEFTPTKIEELARDLHQRMDKQDAKEFAETLLKLY